MQRYFRTHILSNTPLKGYYRYRDEFQVYPIESDALKCPVARHYPMYLEYSVDVPNNVSSKHLSIETLNKEKEIVRLLSVFTTFRFFYYTGDRDQWGCMIPPIPYDELTLEQQKLYLSQTSFWIQAVVRTKYLPHEIEINGLSNLSCAAVECGKDVDSYYAYINDDPIMQYYWLTQPKIIVSPVLTECLYAYYTLPDRHKKLVRSSIYLAYDGLEVKTAHKALGYLSVVSALEGLTKVLKYAHPERRSNGKLNYPKKQKVFSRMLQEYFSNAVGDIEQYNDAYITRCSIAHDNAIFAFDYGLLLDEMDMRPSEDWHKQYIVERLYRYVLTNMMLDVDRKNWTDENDMA